MTIKHIKELSLQSKVNADTKLSRQSVVAGANLMFGPDMSILLGAAKILSPEGKSKMWDANANGFARGEGFGVTILKPLDAALRDGDTVRAVVLASAANEDGRTPGISLPNSEAQQELIRTAYRKAGVDPAETGYVEAHGTGTQAGDPLEARAILKTIGDQISRKSELYVGSVKSTFFSIYCLFSTVAKKFLSKHRSFGGRCWCSWCY